MTTCSSQPDGAAATPALPRRSEAKPGPWFFLPLAWCAWLLVWLVPSLIMAPRLSTVRPWYAAETAPLAVAAAAAIFLVTIWPFWPALAAGARQRPGSFLGRSIMEAVILVALAAPFLLVASAVEGRPPAIGRSLLAAGVLVTWGLGLRLAAAGLGQGAGRWLIAAALLVAAGPVAISYAGNETLGNGFPAILQASPVIGGAYLAVDGWPAGTWSWIAQVFLWPAAGLSLAALGLARTKVTSDKLQVTS
jgi:hypothetical protein